MSNKTAKKTYGILTLCCILAIIAVGIFTLFMPMSSSDKTEYVYVDKDDNIDSVYAKIEPMSHFYSIHAFKILSRHLGYAKNVRSGRYEMSESIGALQMLRHMRNGQQAPIDLTVPSVRTKERLAEELSENLMLSKDSILDAMEDNELCKSYGYDTLTIQCMFIPNTYDIYWNVSVKKLFDRFSKESKNFWNDERTKKAKAIPLTEVEVITLASIVDEETSNNGEKPMVAGMYINRLKAGMPLQADPTIKYALQQFELRRIYTKMLSVDSPYNTYRNIGLPPGPIRIPSIAGIDAVLNHVHHNFMYMCAKEDFSGTHNFAVSYAEHLKNAAKYSAALNARNIK